MSALPRSSPAAEGVDAAGVHAFVDGIERLPGVEPHGFTVLRHGREIASGHWAPYRRDAPRLLYSLSKSFTSTAVGLAAAEGLLHPDDLVLDHFGGYAGEVTDPRIRSWRIHHLLTMSTGHTTDTAPAIFGHGEDPVRLLLQLPPDHDPGSVFCYNQGATYTAAAIVQELAGCTLPEYLRPRLFDRIGIGPVSWLEEPAGRSLGFSGLHASHDDVVRLGLLHLRRGRWDGAQLLPGSWVDTATSRQIATAEPNPDWQQGYGYQFWMGRHGYRGDGAYGQFCLVLPEQDAVVVITSATVGMQSVLDLVYRTLLPAFRAQPLQGATDDAELAARLAGLQVPTPAAAAGPAGPAGPYEGSFTPRGGSCRVQPSLQRVDVRRGPDATWRVTLVEADTRFTVTVRQDWATQDVVVEPGAHPLPVAAAGGFGDNGELRVHLRFLDTPHTFTLIVDPRTRTFRGLWPTIPLHGTPLHALHAPWPDR